MHKIEEIEEEDGSSIKKPKMNKKSGNKINNVIKKHSEFITS